MSQIVRENLSIEWVSRKKKKVTNKTKNRSYLFRVRRKRSRSNRWTRYSRLCFWLARILERPSNHLRPPGFMCSSQNQYRRVPCGKT